MSDNTRKRQKIEDNSETSKISKSCDLCKLKKVKCDGLRPMCSFCEKNQMSSCNYSLMKKPGLKPGYGRTMVQRLDNLEDEVKSLKDQLLDIVNNYSKSENNDLKSQIQISKPLDPQSTSSTESANSSTIQIPSLLNPSPNNSFGLPSISQCLLLVDLFFIKISPMFPLLHPSMIPSLENSIKSTSDGIEPSLIIYSLTLITLKFLNSDQMSHDDKVLYYNNCKEKIISTSLKKINLENLQSLILLAYDLLGNSVKVPESWNYVSIASDYATYLKLNDEKSIVTQSTLIAGDSPSSINSSIHSNDTIARKKSKSISNKSLNLLRKPKNWVDEESRRHCFWCIYILDKHYAISSSHEMKLKSNKINCLLPLKLSYWFKSNPSNQMINFNFGHQQRTLKLTTYESPLGNGINNNSIGNSENSRQDASPSSITNEEIYDSFTFYIELNKLVGDIHTFLIEEFNIDDNYEVGKWKMTFKTLENQLFFWMNSLPPAYRMFLETGELNNNKPLEIYDSMFYVYYYTTLVKLHSAAAFPHRESEYFKLSEDSRRICLDSAQKVHQFTSKLVSLTNDEYIFEKLGPLFGFYIWINSRILFVNVVYQSAQQLRENPDLLLNYQNIFIFFIEVLFKIGKVWESSMVYYKILQFLNVSDLSYVIGFISPAITKRHNNNDTRLDDSEENSDDEVASSHREPASVFTDMRFGSHSLVFWFNKLASLNSTDKNVQQNDQKDITKSNNNMFEPAQFSNFQTSSAQSFEEFQLTHDEFFNFLALDINGQGSFQDMR